LKNTGNIKLSKIFASQLTLIPQNNIIEIVGSNQLMPQSTTEIFVRKAKKKYFFDVIATLNSFPFVGLGATEHDTLQTSIDCNENRSIIILC
jgi:hypothetical protein